MTVETLIIGGGLAGSAAAITLARHGREVVLIEREAAPQHKVCGEFLSQEALLYLNSLDIAPAKLGAVPIQAVRLAGAGRAMEAPLPFAAMSLTRKRLDSELLARTEAAGAKVLRGASVQELTREDDAWSACLSGSTITSRNIFVATGKHDLRGQPRPRGSQDGLIAFKMYWRLGHTQTAALAEHVELAVYRGGYAGLQPVENGVANLCCLIDAREYQRLGSRWSGLLHAMRAQCPHLRQRLEGAEPLLPRPLAIAPIPYGFIRQEAEGLWRLGDQAAVIPSFTGDGMSLALHAGKLAAKMYLAGSTPQQFQHTLAGQVKHQVRLATHVSKALVTMPKTSLFAARLWPAALRAIASSTRIPSRNLLVPAGPELISAASSFAQS